MEPSTENVVIETKNNSDSTTTTSSPMKMRDSGLLYSVTITTILILTFVLVCVSSELEREYTDNLRTEDASLNTSSSTVSSSEHFKGNGTTENTMDTDKMYN